MWAGRERCGGGRVEGWDDVAEERDEGERSERAGSGLEGEEPREEDGRGGGFVGEPSKSEVETSEVPLPLVLASSRLSADEV